jgi:hypothetical protein
VWVRSHARGTIKGIFGADHVPVVSSGHSGFLTIKIEKVLISLIIGSSEGGFSCEDLDREMKESGQKICEI